MLLHQNKFIQYIKKNKLMKYSQEINQYFTIENPYYFFNNALSDCMTNLLTFKSYLMFTNYKLHEFYA